MRDNRIAYARGDFTDFFALAEPLAPSSAFGVWRWLIARA